MLRDLRFFSTAEDRIRNMLKVKDEDCIISIRAVAVC